jgi:lipopolysaccharide/colanic/teichoic acid biosynthesis glycosyltransferase
MEQGVAIDIEYVRRLSPWLDLRILALTLPAVVRSARASLPDAVGGP